MRMYDIISNKKSGKKLNRDEIRYFIEGYVCGNIPDYQVSALLMAVCFNGLDFEETAWLTEAMVDSGEVVDLSDLNGITVDKHSTGGVGDKTSLVLLPMLAACGLKASKMSGRGLGHTGGTLDKLESIKGFNINLNPEEVKNALDKNGFVICGQTLNIVPADKKLYALRDVTATVDSIPLIASSIMSKKIASGAANIILDVKMGSGAFVKCLDDAVKLASTMVEIGNKLGRNIRAVITNMDEPLGYSIGNSIEVMESIDTLKGHGPEDLKELCIFLAANLLEMTGLVDNIDEGMSMAANTLSKGAALERFRKFLSLQHGNSYVVDDYSLFDVSSCSAKVYSTQEGYVHGMESELIGEASLIAGAGRERKEDSIDYGAGIQVFKKVNERVEIGDTIAVIYTERKDKISEISEMILKAYTIGPEKNIHNRLIYGTVTTDGFIEY